MKNIERALHAVIPEDGSRQEKPAKREKTKKAAEQPYIVAREGSVSYLGVEVPKGQGGRLVPSETEFKEEYFYLEGHYKMMREVATALKLNKPILLEGGTGVYNKTTTIARMCRDLNMNYCKVNFDRETAREDVIGGQTLKVDENGKEHLAWYDGDLMYAIRNGGVAFLDEYNRQSKLAGVINPIIDAILNGRKEISNPYNENERVKVHPDFRLVAAQNPPGIEEGHEYTDRSQLPAETFGRWIYKKLPIEYSEDEENKLVAGMIGENVDLDLAETEFRHAGEGMPVGELAEIPGMTHWRKEMITILRLLRAKSSGAKREMAKSQKQNLYFNPRLEKTILDHIARFYNGDINETVKNAFETCVVGMYASEADKQKIRLLLDQAAWKPPAVESKRKGLERKTKTEEPVKIVSKASEAVAARRAELAARARALRTELSGETPGFSPEHMEVMHSLFGKDNLKPADIPNPAELTAAYFDKMYPKEQREKDKKKGLVSFHPSWWDEKADSSIVGPEEETWGQAYIRSMQHEADELFKTSSAIYSESIQKPKYIDGSQQYGTIEGEKKGKDWLIPILEECFGEGANRFDHSHDELIEKLLPKVKEKIKASFKAKGLPIPNLKVILEPALVFNRQTTEQNPKNSQTGTWEITSTVLRKQDNEDSGHRLNVGRADRGGAGYVDDGHRGYRNDSRGCRLAVVLQK